MPRERQAQLDTRLSAAVPALLARPDRQEQMAQSAHPVQPEQLEQPEQPEQPEQALPVLLAQLERFRQASSTRTLPPG